MAEAHESLPLLVPESIGHGFEARWQRHGFDPLEVRVCVMTALEMDTPKLVLHVKKPHALTHQKALARSAESRPHDAIHYCVRLRHRIKSKAAPRSVDGVYRRRRSDPLVVATVVGLGFVDRSSNRGDAQ
jgi:hypothetical protein